MTEQTRIVCVNCDSVFTAEPTQATLHDSLPALPDLTEAQSSSAATAVEPETFSPEFDDVLALPETTDTAAQPEVAAELPAEQTALFGSEPLDIVPDTGEPTPVPEAATVASTLAASGEFALDLAPETALQAEAEQAEAEVASVGPAAPPLPAVQRGGDYDKYKLGMRLMRVSPVWLLLCGLTFLGVIVLCNELTGSADQIKGTPPASQRVAAATRADSADTVAAARPNLPPATQHDERADAASNAPAPAATQTEPVKTDKPAPPPAPQTTPAVATKPTTETKPAPAPQTASGTGGLTLQVGSYPDTTKAAERVARLQAAGFDARTVAIALPNRGIWYRVQTGRFNDRAEAARYGAQLRAKGAAADFIVTEAAAQ